MDTKWKKSKVLLSYLAFVIGLTMMVTNMVPAVSMAAAFGTEIFQIGRAHV